VGVLGRGWISGQLESVVALLGGLINAECAKSART
jgi:hypothetical protein